VIPRRSLRRRWPGIAGSALLVAGLAASPLATAAGSLGDRSKQSGTPAVTLLHQNFPNPFPAGGVTSTCLWFDLHRTARVRLTIHGIRGHLVRTMVPAGDLAGDLPAGRYGRGSTGPGGSCDPRLTWDGRGDDGRLVEPGVYLVRLRTETHESFRRILFRGQ
jgi:hypothetical protein